MSWFVYIIYSKKKDIYYKGENDRPYHRLADHNNNKSTYTAFKGPWDLVYLEAFPSRTDALKREKMLKKQNRKYLEWLIKQPSNLLL